MTSAITTPSQFSLTTFPEDVVGHIMHCCNPLSLGKLIQTCHFLCQQAFTCIAKGFSHNNVIFSRLLLQKDSNVLEGFLTSCAKTQALVNAPITLCITPMDDLPKALQAIHAIFPIQGLNMMHRWTASDVLACLQVCPTTKGISFQNCCSINFREIPEEHFYNIEELYFKDVTFITNDDGPEEQQLSEIANRCKKLKNFSFERCYNFDPDFHNFSLENSCLEFFSETNWSSDDVRDTWLTWVRGVEDKNIEYFRNSQKTSALSAYFFASYKLALSNILTDTDYREITERLYEIIKKNPRFVNPKVQLALLIKNNEPAKAEALLRESIVIAPQNLQAHVELGFCLLYTKKTQEAYAHFENTLSRCIAHNDMHSLLRIADVMKTERFQRSQQLLDHVFWEAFQIDSQNLLQRILEIDPVHTLTIVYFADLQNMKLNSKVKKDFKKRAPIYAQRGNVPGLLVSAFCTKESIWLESIKKIFIENDVQEGEQALKGLMENLFGVQSWITFLQALLKSKQDIVPCLSLLALFMGELCIPDLDFYKVATAFNNSHAPWFRNGRPAIVGYKKFAQVKQFMQQIQKSRIVLKHA